MDTATGAVDATKNTGQVARIEGYIGAQKQWQQHYSYDKLGRLSLMSEYEGTSTVDLTYRMDYSFDRYGNRSQDGGQTSMFLKEVFKTAWMRGDSALSSNRTGKELWWYVVLRGGLLFGILYMLPAHMLLNIFFYVTRGTWFSLSSSYAEKGMSNITDVWYVTLFALLYFAGGCLLGFVSWIQHRVEMRKRSTGQAGLNQEAQGYK